MSCCNSKRKVAYLYAWKECGLPISTTSNEAAKLFDAVLRQYVSWMDCDSLGGIENSCKNLLNADPNFVLGRTLVLGLDIIGTGRSTRLDEQFARDIRALVSDGNETSVFERERKHAFAIQQFADGFMTKATEIWEEILVEHPTDLLALKFAHDAYFYLGDRVNIRDGIGKVIGKWKVDMPCYSYLKGMWAFGLEECAQYTLAEKEAKEALDMQRHDGWATHALGHVLDMNGRFEEGIKFLDSTENDWEPCGMISCHLYWHYAAYLIERQYYNRALDVFDRKIAKRVSSGALLDIVDACSILYRLQLEGISVGDRWDTVYKYSRPHMNDHILTFNDAHIYMAIIGRGYQGEMDGHRRSLVEYISSSFGDNKILSQNYGLPIFDALDAFHRNDFPTVVEKLYPISRKLYQIGGSNAQRDIFDQLLIHSCMKSPQREHQKLTRNLLIRRNKLRKNSEIGQRLASQFQALHFD